MPQILQFVSNTSNVEASQIYFILLQLHHNVQRAFLFTHLGSDRWRSWTCNMYDKREDNHMHSRALVYLSEAVICALNQSVVRYLWVKWDSFIGWREVRQFPKVSLAMGGPKWRLVIAEHKSRVHVRDTSARWFTRPSRGKCSFSNSSAFYF